METSNQIEVHQTQSSSSSSSSIDSNNYNYPSAISSICKTTDLSTDLKLGLSISPSSQSQLPFNSTTTSSKEETLDWPPINKSILRRNTLVEKQNLSIIQRQRSLFVKVYMEGIPIGRKLNLLEHHSYDELVKALCHMFRTIILCPNSQPLSSWNFHVLTYEDQEGDWMMVGDVPWEMFLSSVKRLKITRADSC
ncbi:unnamed protein product [Lathyrus sativus]|nr:unnamed protein product [Lathyrus sativus]